MSPVRTYRSRRARGGFTLLEILTATTMFSIVVGALYSVFYGSLRLRETTYEAIETGLPSDYVVEIIKRDLADCVAPGSILAEAFYGDIEEVGDLRNDSMEMYTASGIVNDIDPWGNIQKVEYYLAEPEFVDDWDEEQGYELVRGITRNLLSPFEEEPEEERLLGGVASLEMMYYDGEEWQESWDSTEQEDALPAAVNILLLFAPTTEDRRTPLPIEVVVPIVAKPRPAPEATSTPEDTSTPQAPAQPQPQGQGQGQGPTPPR